MFIGVGLPVLMLCPTPLVMTHHGSPRHGHRTIATRHRQRHAVTTFYFLSYVVVVGMIIMSLFVGSISISMVNVMNQLVSVR